MADTRDTSTPAPAYAVVRITGDGESEVWDCGTDSAMARRIYEREQEPSSRSYLCQVLERARGEVNPSPKRSGPAYDVKEKGMSCEDCHEMRQASLATADTLVEANKRIAEMERALLAASRWAREHTTFEGGRGEYDACPADMGDCPRCSVKPVPFECPRGNPGVDVVDECWRIKFAADSRADKPAKS